jgi:hypothetical protein
MELKTGDKVSFLNEIGGGTIVKIIDNETVSVLNEDGFEIPVLKSEVIIDKAWSPDAVSKSRNSDESTNIPPSKKEEPEEFEDSEVFYTDSGDVNIYLAAVPKNQKFLTDEGFDMFLINDSNYFLQYNLSRKSKDDFYILKGEAEPNIKIFLKEVARTEIKDDIDFLFQTTFYDKRPFARREPVTKDIRLKAAKLFKEGAYKPNDFFDEKALIVTILEDNPMNKALEQLKDKKFAEAVKREKQPARKESKQKSEEDNSKSYKEVDLHIHELLDDETGMSDADKLNYQMDRFRQEMDDALKAGKPRKIVFIHGVGGGSLKHQLRRELQRKYKSCLFQDASYAEYGYGATMVLLRKPK